MFYIVCAFVIYSRSPCLFLSMFCGAVVAFKTSSGIGCIQRWCDDVGESFVNIRE